MNTNRVRTDQIVRMNVLDAINSGDFGPSFYNIDGIVAELISTYNLGGDDVAAQLFDVDPDDFMDMLDRYVYS